MTCEVTYKRVEDQLRVNIINELVESNLFNKDLSLRHPLQENISFFHDNVNPVEKLFNAEESFKLANDLFPDRSKVGFVLDMPIYKDVMDRINTKYRDTVITKDLDGDALLSIPQSLVIDYGLRSKDREEFLNNLVRDTYISQFSNAKNLEDIDDYFKHPLINKPTTQYLLKLAKQINPNIEIRVVDDLDQKAVSIISKGIILLRSDSLDSLPEELAHFLIKLLPEDNILKSELRREIVNTPEYQELFKVYANNAQYQTDGKPNIQKIKDEIAGKYLSKFFKKESKLKYILNKILSFFKLLFNKQYGMEAERDEYFEGLFQDSQALSSLLNLPTDMSISEDIWYNIDINAPVESENIKEVKRFLYSIRFNLQEKFKGYYDDKGLNVVSSKIKELVEVSGIDLDNTIRIIQDSIKSIGDEALNEELRISEAIDKIIQIFTSIEKIPAALAAFKDRINKVFSKEDFYKTGVFTFEGKQYTPSELMTLSNGIAVMAKSYVNMSTSLSTLGDEVINMPGFEKSSVKNRIKDILSKIKYDIDETSEYFTFKLGLAAATKYIWDNKEENILEQRRIREENLASRLKGITNPKEIEWNKQKILTDYGNVINTIDDIEKILQGRTSKNLNDAGADDYANFLVGSILHISDAVTHTPLEDLTSKAVAAKIVSVNRGLTYTEEFKTLLNKLNLPHLETLKKFQQVNKLVSDTGREYERVSFIKEYDNIKFKEELSKFIDETSKKLKGATTEEKAAIYEEREAWIRKHQENAFTQEYYDLKDELKRLNTDVTGANKKIKSEVSGLFAKLYVKYIDMQLYAEITSDEELEKIQNEIDDLQKQITEKALELTEEERKTVERRKEINSRLYVYDENRTKNIIKLKETQWVEDRLRELHEDWRSGKIKSLESDDILRPILVTQFNNLYKWEEKSDLFKEEERLERLSLERKDDSLNKELVAIKQKLYKEEQKLRFAYNLPNGEVMSTIMSNIPVIARYNNILEQSDIAYQIARTEWNYLSALENTEDKSVQAGIKVMFAKKVTEVFLNNPFYSRHLLTLLFSKEDSEKVNSLLKDKDGDFINLSAFEFFSKIKESNIDFRNDLEFLKQKLDFNKLSDLYIGTTGDRIAGEADVEEIIRELSKDKRKLYDNLYKKVKWEASSDYLTNVRGKLIGYLKTVVSDRTLDEVLPNASMILHRLQLVKNLDDMQSTMDNAFIDTMEELRQITDSKDIKEFLGVFLSLHKEVEDELQGTKNLLIPQIFKKSLPIDRTKRVIKTHFSLNVTMLNPALKIGEDKKFNYAHPDVLSGKIKPNVNMNGEFLPKSIEFQNPLYNKIQSDPKLKELYDFMNKIFFLEQMNNPHASKRNDVVVPAKFLNNWEEKENFKDAPKRWWEQVKQIFTSSDDGSNYYAQLEGLDTLSQIEEQGTEAMPTKVNRAAFLNTIKMRTRMPMPAMAQTKDLMAGILDMIEDIEMYKVKKEMQPIFELTSKLLEKSSISGAKNVNKNRFSIIDNSLNTNIYGNVPDVLGSHSVIAKFIDRTLTVAARSLNLAPLSSIINYGGGRLQILLDRARFSKDLSNAKAYSLSTVKAPLYLLKLEEDYIRQDGKFSKEMQIMVALNFFQKSIHLSSRSSEIAKYTDIRQIMLAPRKPLEDLLAIQYGLIFSFKQKILDKAGKEYSLHEIYTLKDGKLVVADKFSDEVKKDWHPETGKKLDKFRLRLLSDTAYTLGNVSEETKPYLAKIAVTKPLLFMKNYLFTGFFKRFSGTFGTSKAAYNSEEAYMLGNHAALLQIFGDIAKGIYKKDLKYRFNNLKRDSVKQKKALNSLIEIGAILVSIFMIGLFGFDDDDKNKWKKVKKMELWQQQAIYILMRMNSELSTFTPLWGKYFGLKEMGRSFLQPFAAVSNTWDKYMKLLNSTMAEIAHAAGADNDKAVFYQKDAGHWYNEKGDRRIVAALFKIIGYSDVTMDPVPEMKVINNQK